jgi:O-antigen/teichoic acid export membrane protein
MNVLPRRASLISGVLGLTAANAIGQCINLLGLLILSRIYTTSQMGGWALFMTVGIFLPIFAGMRYELALVLSRTKRATQALMGLVLVISIGLALLAGFMQFVWRNMVSGEWLAYESFLGAFALFILGWGLNNVGVSLATQRTSYRVIAVNRVFIALLTVGLQIALHDWGLFGNGLIAGTVLGMLFSGLFLIGVYRHDYIGLIRALCHKRGWYEIGAVARRYRAFPIYSLPYSVLSNLHMQITMFAVGMWYGLSSLGQFSLAQRTLYTPLTLANSSLSQVLMPRLPEVHSKRESMQRLFVAIIRLIGYTIAFPLAVVSIWGGEIYAIIFGEPWHEAGLYAAAQVPAIFAMAITLWMERIFDALGKQRLHLWLSAGLNFITLFMFVAAHLLYRDSLITILVWSAGMLVYGVVWLAVAFHVCRFAQKQLVGLLGELAGVSLFLIGTLFVIDREFSDIPSTLLAVALCGVVFATWLWIRLREDISRLWRG